MSSTISAGLVNVTNLTVTGTQSGAIQATNLGIGGNLDIGGNIAVQNDYVVNVKETTVNVTNSMFSDLLATTQSGRTALAKALDYGQSKDVFEVNGYLPLLDAGYSGKGVLYGHCERDLQFRVPSLRHVVAPEHIFTTSPESFSQLQMINHSINSVAGPHTYATATMAVGFDPHAKLADTTYAQISDQGWSVLNPDAFIMGAGYNADVVDIQQWFSDPIYYTEFPDQLQFFEDVWVEVMEKAFLRGVKVTNSSTSFKYSEGYYYQFDTSGDAYTGMNNPLSYIASLAADHDLVYCESINNNSFRLNLVPSPGSGYMPLASPDARNILAVGSKLVDDGTVYPVVADYLSYDEIISYDNYIVDKDYAQVNYYTDGSGHYSVVPKTGYNSREIGSYNGFGRMVDTAGPGRTHRLKPDIISAQGTDHQFVAWPSTPEADNTTNWVYGRILNPATSATCPTLAGGVCLLREALPQLDAHQIRECVMLAASNGDLTDPDTDVGLGYGLVNMAAALAYGQARPNSLPPTFPVGIWPYSDAFLALVAENADDTLSPYQPFDTDYNFIPKSVQSFKCPQDPSGNIDYLADYATYTTAYNAYVASATDLWTTGVLDLSPPKGLWGTSPLMLSSKLTAPTFKVVSNKSWISVHDDDVDEIKDLMISKGIKVRTISKLLGAISVIAESPEQLASVVNGNVKVRHVTPVMKLKLDSGF